MQDTIYCLKFYAALRHASAIFEISRLVSGTNSLILLQLQQQQDIIISGIWHGSRIWKKEKTKNLNKIIIMMIVIAASAKLIHSAADFHFRSTIKLWWWWWRRGAQIQRGEFDPIVSTFCPCKYWLAFWGEGLSPPPPPKGGISKQSSISSLSFFVVVVVVP